MFNMLYDIIILMHASMHSIYSNVLKQENIKIP